MVIDNNFTRYKFTNLHLYIFTSLQIYILYTGAHTHIPDFCITTLF